MRSAVGAAQNAVKSESAVLTTQKKNCIIILGLFLCPFWRGANGPARCRPLFSVGASRHFFIDIYAIILYYWGGGGCNTPCHSGVRPPTLSRAVYDRLLFFMHFSVPAGTRRSRPGRCGRRHRSGCGNKCRIHDDPDPYDIVEAVNDLTEAVEAVQKSIIWTRKARTCTGGAVNAAVQQKEST